MACLSQSFFSASKTFVLKFQHYDAFIGKNFVCCGKNRQQTDRRRRNRNFPVIVGYSSAQSSVSEIRDSEENRGRELEYLVSEHGWSVRRLVEDDEVEMRRVTLIQAEAFHIPMALFNDIFFFIFQAEVLSGLLYKLRNSPPNRYACLVAEADRDSSSSSEDSGSRRGIVGVVDVTALRDESVLRLFPDVQEYLYVSGLAVSNSLRRRRVGSTLLKACDVMCFLWGFKLLALRAYEDDQGARKLYSKAGYQVVAADPPWITSWIGRKRRLLMIKQFP